MLIISKKRNRSAGVSPTDREKQEPIPTASQLPRTPSVIVPDFHVA